MSPHIGLQKNFSGRRFSKTPPNRVFQVFPRVDAFNHRLMPLIIRSQHQPVLREPRLAGEFFGFLQAGYNSMTGTGALYGLYGGSLMSGGAASTLSLV